MWESNHQEASDYHGIGFEDEAHQTPICSRNMKRNINKDKEPGLPQ